MKFLKYALIFIVVVVLLFFGKGLLTPSISYENEITVNTSAKEAWVVMNDESNLPKWIEGFKKVELVSGTPNTVGAVSNVYVEEQGQEMIMQETITSVKENEHMAMTFTMDFMDMDYKMSFEEQGGQTIIKSASTVKGNGIMAKSMISFMKGSMESQEDTNLGKLKAAYRG